MKETGKKQLLLTDEDARIMKSKDGVAVSYNPQTVVDLENHLIRDYKMTNQVTDHGLIALALERIREENPEEILDVVADKGYLQAEDMVACLEQGIIPNVMLKDGKDEYELEISYEETEIKTKFDQETIKESLHAGRIPKVYQEVITDMQVMEVWRKTKSEESDEILKSVYGTEDEMKERAWEGFFVRDPERNVVYCPNGETLRQKCIKKNRNIGYSNKYACKPCPNCD